MKRLIICLLLIVPSLVYSQLYINEIMASNDTTAQDNVGEYDDWIEIYNAGSSAVNLDSYYISDDPTNLQKWQIPSTNTSVTTIPPQGYLLLWADTDISQGENHIDFKLTDQGETIVLTFPDGVTVIDSITFPPIGTDNVFGRLVDGQDPFNIISPATPASSNSGSLPTVGTIVMNPSGSLYTTTQLVSLSSPTPNTSIYYTLDGSIPTPSSNLYTGPITINSTNSIRAIGVKSGYIDSYITTESYVINFTSTYPIVYITTDPYNLWDDTDGIYTIGTNGVAGYCTDTANFNQNWEVETHFDLYMPDGTQPIDHNAGMKISGNCSRRNPQKPLMFLFRDEYEPEGNNEIEYKLFKEKEIDKFKRLYLRKGNGAGISSFSIQYSDPLCNLIVEDQMDVETSGVRIVEVFLNNEYWGMYDLREKFDQHRFVRQYKWATDTDSIDIVRNPGRDYPTTSWWAQTRTTHGTMDDYLDFEAEFLAKDLSIQSNYEDIIAQMDEDQMMNWLISGVFLCNVDWISNNVKVWKHGDKGEWRWAFVDFDHTLRIDRIDYDILTNKIFYTWPNGGNATVNPLYQKLLSNQEFQDEFIQRTATLMNTVFDPSRVTPIADSLKNVYLAHNTRAFNRWDGDNSNSHYFTFANTNAQIDSIFQTYEDFMQQRPTHVIDQYTTRWGLSGMYTLTVNTNSNTNGSVAVNEIYKVLPHNFSGDYFNGIPFKIVAVPDPGYRFSHWQETGSTDPVLFEAYSANTTLTPIFEASLDLVINEIHYNPVESDSLEFIEIYNPDSESKSLEGYQIDDGVCMIFPPNSSIAPGEYIVIAKDANAYTSNAYQVFQWQHGSLANSGEHISLVNQGFKTIDSLTFNDGGDWPGTPDKGYFSLALLDPEIDNAIGTNWSIQSQLMTPGKLNNFSALGVHGPPTIVINEIHYNPADSISTINGNFLPGEKFEFVELKNVTSSDINISGYFFSKGIDFLFPTGTIMPAGGFIVLAEDMSSFEDRYGFVAFGKYDGKLSNAGESVWLNKSNGTIIDAVSYSSSFPWDTGANGGLTDESLALINATVDNNTKLNWSIQCNQLFTPGAENDFSCFTGLNYAGLVINEFYYNPNAGSNAEFIEIINSSSAVIDLESVSLSSGINYTFDQRYLPGTPAFPLNYIVLAKDSITFHNAYGRAPDGTYSGVLSNYGERLALQDLFGVIIDELTYDDVSPWDPLADQGAHSLALLDPNLDNSLASSWCIQDVGVTPYAVNHFTDSDNDTVPDCLDQCPNLDDSFIGTSCDDGDPCTQGDEYDSFCNCVGVYLDSDGDSVCDAIDLCPGFDDLLDMDANGIPDDCESCDDFIYETNYPSITTAAVANIDIVTNGNVSTSMSIDYRAGNSIELLSGFEVELGAVYHADIQPCN